jgi:hypothetical protein
MATTKITSPDLFDLASLNTALQLPSGTTAERPTSPSTGEWRYNTTTNLVEFWDGGEWRDLQSEDIPPVPTENFNTVLYTGNGSTQSITGVGFQPDFVWIKSRSAADNHYLQDSSRGSTYTIYPNLTNAQFNETTAVTSFDTGGFTTGNYSGVNTNGTDYVAWCLKANGGTTSSNTDGTITSTVQANTKPGFSIVQWTGTGSAGTLGHGLSSAPELIMVKDTTVAYNWYVYTTATGSNIGIEGLNTSAASFAASSQMTTTNTLITNVPSIASLNTSGSAMIIYAFHSVAGYSKIGSYTGNGSANGPIVNTGFEPAFLIVKGSSNTGSWLIFDNKRNTTNPRNKVLRADSSAAETTSSTIQVDFLTNGFQLTGADTDYNGSGRTYIYMAFAADQSAAPTLADSFANKLYTGTGSSQSITGLGFSPNLVWLKERGQAANHRWLDTLRGATNAISSSLTAAQFTDSTGLTSFDTDGFTLGANVDYNNNGGTFVAWNWKANPVPTINIDGTIQSLVSANQASGFSIVNYTGDGTSGSTVGHNLGTTPQVVIYKRLDAVASWIFKSTLLNTDDYLALNLTDQVFSDSGVFWNGTAPTSTVFTLGNSASVNTSSANYIAYCFAPISGFSKFGSYTGTGSSNPITGLGFSPNWVMIKARTASENWAIFDTSRGENVLYANGADAESAFSPFTFDSDGFTVPAASGMTNGSGQTYIYMAFKENPTPYPLAGNMSFLVVAGGGGGGYWMGGGAGAGVHLMVAHQVVVHLLKAI